MRLPTEAEWEYAARAGDASPRYGPLDEVAWYTANSGSLTHEPGQKKANRDGLFDMLGNVWEWVSDWYGPYAAGNQSDPQGPPSGVSRAVRGGSWLDTARYVRVSYRSGFDPLVSDGSGGFVAPGTEASTLPKALADKGITMTEKNRARRKGPPLIPEGSGGIRRRACAGQYTQQASGCGSHRLEETHRHPAYSGAG